MPDPLPSGFVIYVRSQQLESRPDFPVLRPWSPTRILGTALTGAIDYGRTAGAPDSETHPGVGLPPEESQCLSLVLDLARRSHTPIRVVDVTKELAPRDVVEDPNGEPRFFPVLVRPDGAQLAGESEFLPGRVKRFLEGR